MNTMELMRERHSVRQYQEKSISLETREELDTFLRQCNQESGLHMQIVYNERNCFDSFMAHYGKFSGVSNYIAIVGKKGSDLEEKAGYYGEKIVLKAQELGLNTCWVAMTYGKGKCKVNVNKDEKLVCVISLGYGVNQGNAHKIKEVIEVSNWDASKPAWFKEGVEAALLAPTAMNQQKFYLTYNQGEVSAKAGSGFYTKLDLGIVKYHFEAVSGHKVQ